MSISISDLWISTGEKPYACGLGDCKSSFGDPSSCARHRKETHRRPAGYRCPIVDCKTRHVSFNLLAYICILNNHRYSIKRKSVFTDHLSKKHGLVFQDQEIESCLPLSLPKLPSILRTPSPTPSSPKTKIRSKNRDRPSPNLDNEWVDDSKTFDPPFFQPESVQLPEPYLSWNHPWGQDNYPMRASSSTQIYDERLYQQDQQANSANTTPSTSPTSGSYPVPYSTNPNVYKNPVYMATPHGSDAYQKDLHYSYNTTLALPDTTIHMGIDFSRHFATGYQGNTSTGSMFYNYP